MALMYITGDTVAVLLNNLGATSEMEMNIALKEVVQHLGEQSHLFY